MTTTKSTVGDKPARHGKCFLILTAAALLPALGYFVMAMVALLFGNLRPLRWLADGLFAFSGAWSIPMLLVLAIGGPVASIVASLILRMEHRSGYRLGGVCGGVGVVLVVLNVLLIMFLLPFAFDD